MALASSASYQEAATQRTPEGWQTCRLAGAKHKFLSGKGERLILSWQHPDSGTEFEQWMNVNDPKDKNFQSSKRDIQLLNKLCEYNGITWGGDADGDAVAKLITANVSAMDVQISWGRGDGVFVNDYAGPGQAPENDSAPQPEPTTQAQPAERQRKVGF
jgi:hypothetical protein